MKLRNIAPYLALVLAGASSLATSSTDPSTSESSSATGHYVHLTRDTPASVTVHVSASQAPTLFVSLTSNGVPVNVSMHSLGGQSLEGDQGGFYLTDSLAQQVCTCTAAARPPDGCSACSTDVVVTFALPNNGLSELDVGWTVIAQIVSPSGLAAGAYVEVTTR
jgi:hypothetical protein